MSNTKNFVSLLQPNNENPITIDTFSNSPVLLSRIKTFNGIKNDIYIMAVYSYLLGWKKTTGVIKPSRQRIADDCLMSPSQVNRSVKALKEMGWIDWETFYKSGKKEVDYLLYKVKEPAEILKDLNTGLVSQGDNPVKINKNPKNKKSQLSGAGSDEQNNNVGSREQHGVEQSPVPVVQSTTYSDDVIRIEQDIPVPTMHRQYVAPTADQIKIWEAEEKAKVAATPDYVPF